MCIIENITVVLVPAAVVVCELRRDDVAEPAVLHSADAIARGIDALHRALCVADGVVDVPDCIRRITANARTEVPHEVLVGTHVHRHVIHPFSSAGHEALQAQNLVAVTRASHAVGVADAVPVACSATWRFTIATHQLGITIANRCKEQQCQQL